MNSSDDTDRKLAEQRACSPFLLKRWQRELLTDEAEGNAEAIERDRRVLDYYLDLYNSTAGLHQADNRTLT